MWCALHTYTKSLRNLKTNDESKIGTLPYFGLYLNVFLQFHFFFCLKECFHSFFLKSIKWKTDLCTFSLIFEKSPTKHLFPSYNLFQHIVLLWSLSKCITLASSVEDCWWAFDFNFALLLSMHIHRSKIRKRCNSENIDFSLGGW